MNANLFLRKVFFFTLLAALLLLHASPADVWAADPPPLDTAADSRGMEATWDEFFEQEMAEYGVPGAIMVAVQGDQIAYIKGYGYADLASQARMDPQTTILRSGSIAKTLTATAIFQLAEQGLLDLDADVNDYLTGYKVPATFPEPVTARHLVNMAAGFDTRWVGVRASSLEEIIPLEEYVAQRMPPRVLPPGRYRRYNDHELVLAGYLVQVISGMLYEDYVQKYIFEPLEMNDSSVYLPDELLSRAARGYPVGGGAEDAYPLNYYYLNTAPGAGFNTTAADMAKYLIAQLRLGSFTRSDGTSVRILQETTAGKLHSNGFSHHPLLLGQANSFDEMFYNGQRYLRKTGGAPGMQNNLVLLPDEGMGLYLFTNTDGFALRNHWMQKVVETYLRGGKTARAIPNPAPEANPKVSADNYSGSYLELSDQTSESTIVQLQALLDPDLWLQVEANDDGSLQVGSQHYIPVDPFLFRNTGSGGYTAFGLDQAGKAKFLFQARFPYQKVSWIVTPNIQLGILGASLLVFLAAAVISTIRALRNKELGALLPGGISALNLLFVVSLIIIMLPLATGGDKWQLSFEPSLALRSVLLIPLLSGALAVALLVKTLLDWRKGSSSPYIRLLNTLVIAGMGAFLFFLDTWNLLGWRF